MFFELLQIKTKATSTNFILLSKTRLIVCANKCLFFRCPYWPTLKQCITFFCSRTQNKTNQFLGWSQKKFRSPILIQNDASTATMTGCRFLLSLKCLLIVLKCYEIYKLKFSNRHISIYLILDTPNDDSFGRSLVILLDNSCVVKRP